MQSQSQNKFNDILKYDLCIGCGLCEALSKENNYIMTLNDDGFYEPKRVGIGNKILEEEISNICPGLNIRVPKFNNNIWGNVTNLYNVSATDRTVRKMGSSGGAISALCIFMLQNKLVDGVLHIGKTEGNSIQNQLFVSRNSEDVLRNASSRYAPAKVLNEIISILENSSETFCFVGKPCDVAALKNYLTTNPLYQKRFKYFLSFFCAGIPSYNGTLKLLERANQKDLPSSLKYRGDGWPGFFKANYENGKTLKISYEDSWGDVLGKHVHSRCKICPDGIGLLADIVFGDAWETKDGYPDFEEREGRSLAISRTQSGDQLIQYAQTNKAIYVEQLKEERISKMQPYQYQRRLFVGYRIIIIQFLTGFMLNFKDTGYLKLMTRYPLHKGVKNSIGTLKRFMFNSKR